MPRCDGPTRPRGCRTVQKTRGERVGVILAFHRDIRRSRNGVVYHQSHGRHHDPRCSTGSALNIARVRPHHLRPIEASAPSTPRNRGPIDQRVRPDVERRCDRYRRRRCRGRAQTRRTLSDIESAPGGEPGETPIVGEFVDVRGDQQMALIAAQSSTWTAPLPPAEQFAGYDTVATSE